MGKKNKKQSQKKKQAKTLKRRSKQKELRKLRPQKRSQEMPGMPGGMPGNIPPDMQAKLNKMALFSAPFMSLGDPTDMGQMQQMAPFIQGFWEAFSEQDTEQRDAILQPLKEAYAQMPWATPDFDELSEILLKRHLYFMPGAHTEEERSRYSKEELKEAAELESFVTEAAAEESSDTFTVRGVSAMPEVDEQAAKSLLNETEQAELLEQQEFLKANYNDIDFIDEGNPVLQKTFDFQNRVLDHFRRYLEHIQLSEEDIDAHLNNVRPFFDPFLKEFHQGSIFSCEEDQVEEYLLDFYIRKVEHTSESEQLLIDSFNMFFAFAGKMRYIENASAILERISESAEEFAELWQDEEDDEEEEEE